MISAVLPWPPTSFAVMWNVFDCMFALPVAWAIDFMLFQENMPSRRPPSVATICQSKAGQPPCAFEWKVYTRPSGMSWAYASPPKAVTASAVVATNLENFTFDSPLVLVVNHRKDTLCQGCATTPIQRNGETREPSRIIDLDQRVMMNFIKIQHST